jgi:hypothetical protein
VLNLFYREKQETLLVEKYKQGLGFLSSDDASRGVSVLEALLKESILGEREFS